MIAGRQIEGFDPIELNVQTVSWGPGHLPKNTADGSISKSIRVIGDDNPPIHQSSNEKKIRTSANTQICLGTTAADQQSGFLHSLDEFCLEVVDNRIDPPEQAANVGHWSLAASPPLMASVLNLTRL